ncbi:MAG: ABC transporter permease [Pyrinomonadaceae bacterium]|nr:ABC transporter permease [Pyrinomonadaceae bacterium]
MNKLLAVIRREYIAGVRTRSFLISTLLGPVLMIGISVLPVLIMSKLGSGTTRIAVVDQTGRMYDRVRDHVTRDSGEATATNRNENTARNGVARARFQLEQADLVNNSIDETKRDLNRRVRKEELDAYIVLPQDVLENGKVEYYARNTSDVFAAERMRNRITSAVIEQRMSDAQIDQGRLAQLQRRVELDAIKVGGEGEQRDAGGSFWLAYAVGGLIYVMVLLYGNAVLAAVVEEKTTRVSEVLFSSIRPLPLLVGKILGVSLVALTQFLIWVLVSVLLGLYGAGAMAASGGELSLPRIAPEIYIYIILFFLVGYFVYSTCYALVGSMVTTSQEGTGMAMPITFMFVIAFILTTPVIRNPNSTFSLLMSIIPFFSPIIMLLRIMTETPPFWQIALSLLIGFASVVGLMWLAARVYRTGMLMYGKRATIPEVMRWVRQS